MRKVFFLWLTILTHRSTNIVFAYRFEVWSKAGSFDSAFLCLSPKEISTYRMLHLIVFVLRSGDQRPPCSHTGCLSHFHVLSKRDLILVLICIFYFVFIYSELIFTFIGFILNTLCVLRVSFVFFVIPKQFEEEDHKEHEGNTKNTKGTQYNR